jgi:superfamily II DNA or RNA helicase
MVLGPSISWMISHGYLVPPKTFAPTIPDLTGVPIKRGDYDEKEVERAMDKRSLVGDIVGHWHRLAKDRPTIVFASGVKHSIHLRDEFRKSGAVAAHIDGDTPLEERKQIIADLNIGKVQVVCNYAVLTEGFDEPALSCGVLARPTKNLGLYLQMAGRTLRPADNKEDSRIIDHSGNVYEHGFVQDDHDWVLEEGKALRTSSADRQREFDEKKPITCVKCATIYTGQLPCPHCGHIPEKYGKYVESRSGDLMEVRAEKRRSAKKRVFTMDEKREWFRGLHGYAQDREKSDGWVAHTYRAKFGVWPNAFNKDRDTPIEPSGEVRSYIRHRGLVYRKKLEAEKRRRNGTEQNVQGKEEGRGTHQAAG